MNRKILQVISWIEIVICILMFAYSFFILVEIELLGRLDRHGYGLMFALYLQAFGGLFGFAGMVLQKKKWYSMLPQVVLILHAWYFIQFI